VGAVLDRGRFDRTHTQYRAAWCDRQVFATGLLASLRLERSKRGATDHHGRGVAPFARKKRKQKLDISAARRSKNAAAGTPLWLKLRRFDLLRDCCGLVVQQVVQQIHNRWK